MLVEKVKSFLEQHPLVEPGDRVLVAYSGGPDSTSLLLMLRQLFPNTAAVYVNHNLRGEESQREEEFVRKFCADRKIPLFVEKLTWGKKRSNLEEEARKKRYRHLTKVARSEGFQKVALAHHREDRLETFFLRLLRGSGPSALTGMKPQRGIFIRPLLKCTKGEILDFLKSEKAPYFADTSNEDARFTRNKIRRELMPYLETQFNPAIRNGLIQTLNWLEEQQKLIDEYLASHSDLIRQEKNEFVISRKNFLELSYPLRKALLRKVASQADPSLRPQAKILKRMMEAIENEENLELPGFLMIESVGDSVRFRSKIGSVGYCEIDVPGAGVYSFPPGNVALHFSISETIKVSNNTDVATLDADKASFPLYIRNWKRGDQFYPFGMSGHKKLSDFWIDAKIPRSQRKRIPLVFKNEDLIWIGGHRIDNRYKITDSTKRILRVELHREHV